MFRKSLSLFLFCSFIFSMVSQSYAVDVGEQEEVVIVVNKVAADADANAALQNAIDAAVQQHMSDIHFFGYFHEDASLEIILKDATLLAFLKGKWWVGASVEITMRGRKMATPWDSQ